MNSQRILLLGSLLLFGAGITYSIFYHLILSGVHAHSLLYNLDMALNMAVKGDFETSSAFALAYRDEAAAREIHNRIPLELMLSGALCCPLLIADRYVEASETMKRIFALLVISGGFILASGEIITVYGPEHWGILITLGGYTWLGSGLLGYLIYTVLYMWAYDAKPSRHRRPMPK